MNEQIKADIEKAKELGKQAYINGKPAAPVTNTGIMELVKKYSSADFSNSKTIVDIFDGFTKSWMSENLSNARSKFSGAK